VLLAIHLPFSRSPAKKVFPSDTQIFAIHNHPESLLRLNRERFSLNGSTLLARALVFFLMTPNRGAKASLRPFLFAVSWNGMERNNCMNAQQELNLSSPIVQRVLRLREKMAQKKLDNEKNFEISAEPEIVSASAQTKKNYQWQMWQKSDMSAYAGGVVHRCK
jgi:hypothetical protein